MEPIFKEKSYYTDFQHIRLLALPINPDKWDSTVMFYEAGSTTL
jgi:hypothetical protein